jgi:hypothetical protein
MSREWDEDTVTCKHDLKDQANEEWIVNAEQLRLLSEHGVRIPLRMQDIVRLVERLQEVEQ